MSGKAQPVRLFDVFVLGPFMVWAGATARPLPQWARVAMVLSGAGTIVYNGVNYMRAAETKIQSIKTKV